MKWIKSDEVWTYAQYRRYNPSLGEKLPNVATQILEEIPPSQMSICMHICLFLTLCVFILNVMPVSIWAKASVLKTNWSISNLQTENSWHENNPNLENMHKKWLFWPWMPAGRTTKVWRHPSYQQWRVNQVVRKIITNLFWYEINAGKTSSIPNICSN